MSIGVVWLELKWYLEKVDKLIKSALDSADCHQVSMHHVIVCSYGNQDSVNRFCFLKLALIDQGDSLMLQSSVICGAPDA